MEIYKNILYIVLSVLLACLCTAIADTPCSSRAVEGESVLCVCNETYCDELTREAPAPDKFVAYMTSKGGLRFNKIIKKLESSFDCCTTTLIVNPEIQYQTIQGFGGAVTDSAAINWKNLSEPLQSHLINSYFSASGLRYSFIRVPIGGTDFSTHAYAYNEHPENDTQLSNFTLSVEDINYKLPMIKAATKAADSQQINILATCWSPPLWMKSSKKWGRFNYLLPEYYQTYANYHIKFLDKYKEQGVDVWGLTTTNEPINGLAGLASFNSLGWIPSNLGKYIVENLGPTIRNSSHKGVKILTHDDQRYSIPVFLEPMICKNPKVLDYIDGIGVHIYTDFFAPPLILSRISRKYPGKFILATEASEGSLPWQKKVVLGSWTRAEHYIDDILEDLNHDVVGWIDWNLCLNKDGGPNWASNFVDSPILVYPEKREFVKQPMFYAIGHLSKFVPRGSKRIYVKEMKSVFESNIMNGAFLTPNGTIVVVLHNREHHSRSVAVRLGSEQASLTLEEHSITTVEFAYKLKHVPAQ